MTVVRPGQECLIDGVELLSASTAQAKAVILLLHKLQTTML